MQGVSETAKCRPLQPQCTLNANALPSTNRPVSGNARLMSAAGGASASTNAAIVVTGSNTRREGGPSSRSTAT